ncbi:MAG: hypothetical protein QMD06_02235 [Candidatus Altarchaeum sp.]|nr:hypothetical protein [Candidatus Altarchaeum sp.]
MCEITNLSEGSCIRTERMWFKDNSKSILARELAGVFLQVQKK